MIYTPDAVQECIEWLQDYLKDRSVPVIKVREDAAKEGYGVWTVYQAARAIDITSVGIGHNFRAWKLYDE